MENGVVTVLYFLQKEEGVPSSHFMTFGTPSFACPDFKNFHVFFENFHFDNWLSNVYLRHKTSAQFQKR